MGRTKLIAANWKMNKTLSEAASFVETLKRRLGEIGRCDIVLFPPFTSLNLVARLVEGTPIAVGAQDLFWERNGAFTGEISASMIKDAGGSYVLVGHSERRHIIGEDDEMVARKFGAALAEGLIPVLCIGEKLEERKEGRAEEVVEKQLRGGLGEAGGDAVERFVIAYEPVWAIGTGVAATPEDAGRMHRFIRSLFSERYGSRVAERVRIQYGGSIKPENAPELLTSEDIDGALVGGASLEVESFIAIANSAVQGKA